MDESKPVPPPDAPKQTQKNELPREASPRTAPSGADPQTLSSLQRAALEMAERAAPRPPPQPAVAQGNPKAEIKPEVKVESAADDKPVKPAAAFKLIEQYDLATPPFSAAPIVVASAASRPAPPSAASAMRPMFDDTFRLTLTKGQSAVTAAAIGLFVLAALGIAAYSWVVAHDWSCRVGLVEKCCPPGLPPKPLPRPEIPS